MGGIEPLPFPRLLCELDLISPQRFGVSSCGETGSRGFQRYRKLASLFVDESDGRFRTENFGFLTPDEAQKKYINNYGNRFDAYFSRALGGFLQELPVPYRQQ